MADITSNTLLAGEIAQALCQTLESPVSPARIISPSHNTHGANFQAEDANSKTSSKQSVPEITKPLANLQSPKATSCSIRNDLATIHGYQGKQHEYTKGCLAEGLINEEGWEDDNRPRF